MIKNRIFKSFIPLVILPITTIIFSPFSCSNGQNNPTPTPSPTPTPTPPSPDPVPPQPVPEPDYLTLEQKQSIDTITKIHANLYSIDMKYQQPIDDIILANQSCEKINECIHSVILPDSPNKFSEYVYPTDKITVDSPYEGGCTSFSLHNDQGHYVVGMNHDWYDDNDFAIIVKFQGNKHKVLGMSDSQFLKMNATTTIGATEKEHFLYCPFYYLEGINDSGLVVTTLLTSNDSTRQLDAQKQNLASKLLPTKLLSDCDNVEQAIELVEQFNFVGYGLSSNYNWHYYLADASGNKAVIEYMNDELHVVNQLPIIQFNANNGTTKLNDVIDANNLDYQVCTNFYLDANDPNCPQPTQTFSQEKVYSPGDYGFWRYQTMYEQIVGLGENKPTNDDMMQFLNNVHYKGQDGDMYYLMKNKYHINPDILKNWNGSTNFSMVFDTYNKSLDICLFENYETKYSFSLN